MERDVCLPAEWYPHRACWLAFPSHEELWGVSLGEAQREFIDLCRAIADVDPQTGHCRGEQLKILVLDNQGKSRASQALAGLNAEFYICSFGDIWLRDTAPLMVFNHQGDRETRWFQFNGWGGKYSLPGDGDLAQRVTNILGWPGKQLTLVLEGGAIEGDGQGTCLTTEQCLLNPNRNPHLSRGEIEAELKNGLGFKKILWLESGLLNDHTDGHIDTLVRFVGPGKVVCMAAQTEADPNAAVLKHIYQTLKNLRDAQGRSLEVVQIPSPGLVCDAQGNILPASYVNFYIGNTTVVVPTYGSDFDQPAVAAIAQLFPQRRTLGLSARTILEGGGAFHCISQQEP